MALEHRKVILQDQHHFTIAFVSYNMDVSALSLLVLRISTIQQQLQDNRINTQKVYMSVAVGNYNPVCHRL